MADDEKKLAEDEVEENTESKDWQWDAAAPLAGDDFLDISIPEKDEEDSEEENEDEAAVDAEEDDVTENEEPEEDSSDEEEEVEDEKNDVPPGHCLICGEKIRNSMSECYCNECRSKYMKVDFGATHIVLSIVMVFVAIIGIVMFSATSEIADSMKKADKLAEEGKISAAVDSYSEVDTTVSSLNERFNAFIKGISSNIDDVTFFYKGKNSAHKEAVLRAKTFSLSCDDPTEFMTFVEESFTEKELNNKKYAQVKGCYDFIKKFSDEYSKLFTDLADVYEPFFTAADAGEIDSKEMAAQIKQVIASVDEYTKKNSDVSACTTAYFKYALIYSAQNCGAEITDDEVSEYINEVYELAGDYYYIFFQDVASFAINAEKYEEAIAVADKVLKNNPSSADAYYYKSLAYLRLEKYDEAIKACDKVAELCPGEYDYCSIKATILRRQGEFRAAIDVCESVPAESKDAEISRQEAIAYYLAGDNDNAVKYAKESYDSAYQVSYNGGVFSLEVVNTSALIYKLCSDDEDYERIVETIESYGSELEESVMDVIKGEKTFEDLFMTGKGDI